MAPDVIDLISSSPPLLRRPATKRDKHHTAQPVSPRRQTQANIQDARSSFTAASQSNIITSSWLSDYSDAEPKKTDASATRGTKRRRTSHEAADDGLVLPAFRTNTFDPKPPLMTTNANQKLRVLSDPIEELTSSPGLAKKDDDKQSGASRTRVSRPQTKNSLSRPLSSDFDPFLSSPQPASYAAANPLASMKEPNLSDPFASSPPPQPKGIHRDVYAPENHVEPKAHFALHESSHNSLRRGGKELETISSSAPEMHMPTLSQNANVTQQTTNISEVISLPSSDLSGSDIEDELPDIAHINVSRRMSRPRTPLRRSRSETIGSKIAKRPTIKKISEQQRKHSNRNSVNKEADKEKKREERLKEKQAKTEEKQRAAALAEVNKIRTDKKVSTPEMLADLSVRFLPDVQVQLETLLEGLDVQYTVFETPVPNVVTWRRKVRSWFNESLGRWEPMALRIDSEEHVAVILTAEELVSLVQSDAVNSHVAEVKRNFDKQRIIYILQGMTPWMRKNRNIRNRQFTSGVRAQDPQTQTNSSRGGSRRKNTADEEYVEEDVIEDAMLRLQVQHDLLIHHTVVAADTARWLVAFTQHISTIPYKKERDRATAVAGFCMESGQVRTGDGAKDTYVRMLQEIVRVTAPIAHGVAAEFDSVSKLVDGLRAGGPKRLEGVRKSANKDGAFSDRTIGQAMSKRMFKVFTGRDEMSTDI